MAEAACRYRQDAEAPGHHYHVRATAEGERGERQKLYAAEDTYTQEATAVCNNHAEKVAEKSEQLPERKVDTQA